MDGVKKRENEDRRDGAPPGGEEMRALAAAFLDIWEVHVSERARCGPVAAPGGAPTPPRSDDGDDA